MSELGYATERQPIPALDLDLQRCTLALAGRGVDLAVHDTGPSPAQMRIEAPLVDWSPGLTSLSGAGGAVVIAHLPQRRWSSAAQPEIAAAIARVFTAGAGALILVTHGPTGELIRLNRPLTNERGPVLMLAPKAWRAFDIAAHAGRNVSLALDAPPSTREAFNLIGRLDRGARRSIVVSTPRSGWGVCAGERGPGVAVFLALARWMRDRFTGHNLVFVSTSSHEFENTGGAAFIESKAPTPDQTALWLHLGAGFAARDWHEAGGRLLPLPSADPQRFLVASSDFVALARAAFAGAPGLEAAYDASAGAAGELATVLAAGYAAAIGMFGAHRFHHTALDDLNCVEPAHTDDVLMRTQRLLEVATI
ncbi:MAG: hypothetical protein KJZ75_00550 [Hyphomonadaceae bacterium]|nr:hypothetical protein [Hyphomonadaceae bacterium]